MTMMHDVLDRPFLYVANKEAGLTIYDITNPASPSLAKTIPTTAFDSLHVMSVSQDGNYVFLALGNHFSNNQKSGMAIVDVTTPSSAYVTDFFELPTSKGGSGIVMAEGNFAYLGAMGNGMIILDISDKGNITFVSQFIPDLTYPTSNPDSTKYNARGMVIKNDIVYLCYDAGGVRIVNVTNKSIPVETGRYSNPVMNGKPRAYNNIVVDDTLIYAAVDYCGMEILNISDTANITLTGWWNPYNCPNNNWFSSPVHANEIQYDKNCNLIFLSTGKSDMVVVDVSDPAAPDSCNFYGGVSNNIGTWGLGLYSGQIYLSYICTFGIPFASNWTGVKILTYDPCNVGNHEESLEEKILIYPNPGNGIFTLSVQSSMFEIQWLDMYNILGEKIHHSAIIPPGSEIDISHLPDGIYSYLVNSSQKGFSYGKILIVH